VFLTVLTYSGDGIWRISSDHEDSGSKAAFDQSFGHVTFHSLKSARNMPLQVKGTQGDGEDRHIHLGSVLWTEPCGQHLDEAHTGRTVHGFANRGSGDGGGHAVVDQTGHHVAGVVW
jgi:hypothetical protein